MNEQDMIDLALAEWRSINAQHDRWATFEAVRFPLETRCAVKHGTVHSNGFKETAIGTIIWSYRHDNGRYEGPTRLTHS
jgi:hypothetical protein